MNTDINTGTGSRTNKVPDTSFSDVLNEVSVREEAPKEASLEDIFRSASKKYNVPLELLKAVAKQESNFTPDAVSRSGAMGIMQLMPATAKGLGVEDAFDPEQNIMGGADYLSQMLKKYDGDIKLSLAAYNAGAGNVKKYGGVPPFEETQNYVVKVTKYMEEDIPIPDKTVTVSGQAARWQQTEAAVPAAVQKEAGTKAAQQDKDAVFSYEDYMTFLKEWEDQLVMFRLENKINLVSSYMEKEEKQA